MFEAIGMRIMSSSNVWNYRNDLARAVMAARLVRAARAVRAAEMAMVARTATAARAEFSRK